MAKLDTAGEWMVNSSHLYVPSNGIKVEHTNLAGSSSGRTEDGVMHIDWVRRDIRKVNLRWKVLTGTELNYILGLMQGIGTDRRNDTESSSRASQSVIR